MNLNKKAQNMMNKLNTLKLRDDIVDKLDIYFDPDDLETLINEDVETLTQYKDLINIRRMFAVQI